MYNFYSKTFVKFFVAIYITGSLSSCSFDKNTWKKAKVNNDIISYEYYIKKHPSGKYIDSASFSIDKINLILGKAPIPELLTPPIALWDSLVIDSFCLVTSVSAPQSKEYTIESKTKYYNFLKSYFTKKGIAVVSEKEGCQTKMIINLKVKALGSDYLGLGFQYSGYELAGKILLKTDGEIPISLSINEVKPCPEQIKYDKKVDPRIEWRKNPGYAMPGLEKTEFFYEFINKVWGTYPAIYSKMGSSKYKDQLSIYDINSILRAACSGTRSNRDLALKIIDSGNLNLDTEQVISLVTYDIHNYGMKSKSNIYGEELNVLKHMRTDAIHATPFLIKYLEERRKKRWPDNIRIETTLKYITGVNFKDDIGGWKKWWFEEKQLYISR